MLTIMAVLAVTAVASGRIFELGTTLDDTTGTAACPSNCQAIGKVSGFQVQEGTRANPYKLNTYGKIVAFTVKLGKPNQQQVQFFTKLFGGPPQLELIVLKPYVAPKGKPKVPNKYILTGSSPLFDLTNFFGSEPTFALPRPLTTKPGYVVGISVPTWAPAFSVNLDDTMQWRSSRDPKACDNVQQDAAQTIRGTSQIYGCTYKTARLLYSVTYIPDPKPTTTPPKTPPKTPTKTGTTTTPKPTK